MATNGSTEGHNGSGLTDMKSLEKHSKYYIPTGDLSFLVEHVLFKVHRYFFERESEYFVAHFASPATPGAPARGSADAHAIVLENVTADEFARFLWVFYNERYSIYDAPVSDWEIILRLATRWAFREVHDLAVRELEKATMLDVDRIALYQANDVNKVLLIPRYAALCARPTPLNVREGRLLGLETSLMVATGREEVRAVKGAGGARSPVEPTLGGTELDAVIREVFEIKETATPFSSSSAGPVPPSKETKEVTKEETNSTTTKPQRPAVQTAPMPPTEQPVPPTPKAQKQSQTPAAKKAAQKAKATQEKGATTPTVVKTGVTSKVDTPSPVVKDAAEAKEAEKKEKKTQSERTETCNDDGKTAGSNSSPGPDTSALLIDVDISGGSDAAGKDVSNGNGGTGQGSPWVSATSKPDDTPQVDPSPFGITAGALFEGLDLKNIV